MLINVKGIVLFCRQGLGGAGQRLNSGIKREMAPGNRTRVLFDLNRKPLSPLRKLPRPLRCKLAVLIVIFCRRLTLILQRVIAAWDRLPMAIRKVISTLLECQK